MDKMPKNTTTPLVAIFQLTDCLKNSHIRPRTTVSRFARTVNHKNLQILLFYCILKSELT